MFVRLERQSFELGICLTVNSMRPFPYVLDLELCYDVVAEIFENSIWALLR